MDRGGDIALAVCMGVIILLVTLAVRDIHQWSFAKAFTLLNVGLVAASVFLQAGIWFIAQGEQIFLWQRLTVWMAMCAVPTGLIWAFDKDQGNR